MEENTNEPLVSVVTPVYNGAKYLKECIESVLSQSYQNWEYIILDNCSTDRTSEIAEKYAKIDTRISVYHNEALLPIMKNWNHALDQISHNSKYCKVVHADDFLFPRCIELMVSVAEAHPTVGIVGSYGLYGTVVVSDGLNHSQEFVSGRELSRLTLLNQIYCFWSPSSLLISTDQIKKRNRFYNENHLHADVEACYEVLKESDFGFVHQVLTFIRKHDESVTAKEAKANNKFQLTNLDLLRSYGPIFLDPIEYKEHLRKKIRQYYHFLALSLFELRDKGFWEFHKNGLKEIGLKFRIAKLTHAVLRAMISRPEKTISTILESTKNRFNAFE
jgi:glycosyltransferase involved in cell wall biosynthesis